MLAMQWQLERAQWWAPEQVLEQQFRQIREVATHASATTPFYREHFQRAGIGSAEELTPDTIGRWPLLEKSALQRDRAALCASTYPKEHGKAVEVHTTGSTGEPVSVLRTEIENFFVNALVLRGHLWHERDFAAKYAALRSRLPRSGAEHWWGAETNVAFRTGPVVTMGSISDPREQLKWLLAERPAYLQTYPTVLRALLEESRATGQVPVGLRQVITFTEMLPADLRPLVHRLWKARVVDVYSCEEFGAVALQCPRYEHYHVQAENLLVEILREDGTACLPGEMGRVVVTALHNFATPLLRYELGDYAEVGEPCPCGRGLPVLQRIVGRVRNLARDPDGRRFRPFIPFDGWRDIAPLRKIQLVQGSLEHIELRYEMERDLSIVEEERLTAMLQSKLGYPFGINFLRVERIERRPGEKYEDFISELA